MTVKELIEILSEHNPEATVIVYAEESEAGGEAERIEKNQRHYYKADGPKIEGETVSIICGR